jgi:hypothetical protein
MRGIWKTNIIFMHFIEYSAITQKQDHYITFSNAEYSKNAITTHVSEYIAQGNYFRAKYMQKCFQSLKLTTTPAYPPHCICQPAGRWFA